MHGVAPRAGNVVHFVSRGARRSEQDGEPLVNALDRHLDGIFMAVVQGRGIRPDREREK